MFAVVRELIQSKQKIPSIKKRFDVCQAESTRFELVHGS